MEETNNQINNNTEGKLFSVSASFTCEPAYVYPSLQESTPARPTCSTHHNRDYYNSTFGSTLNSESVLNFTIPAGCGDASCTPQPVSPHVADASSIIDMTSTPPGKQAVIQNENKRKIETIEEEPTPKKIQEKGLLLRVLRLLL